MLSVGSGWWTRSKNARAAVFASSDRLVGRTTRALTYRSPWPSLVKRGMPWPRSRNVRPVWVPGGMRQQHAALQRLDLDLAAEERLLERQRQLALRSAPRRVKTGSGWTWTMTMRSPPPGALPDS